MLNECSANLFSSSLERHKLNFVEIGLNIVIHLIGYRHRCKVKGFDHVLLIKAFSGCFFYFYLKDKTKKQYYSRKNFINHTIYPLLGVKCIFNAFLMRF